MMAVTRHGRGKRFLYGAMAAALLFFRPLSSSGAGDESASAVIRSVAAEPDAEYDTFASRIRPLEDSDLKAFEQALEDDSVDTSTRAWIAETLLRSGWRGDYPLAIENQDADMIADYFFLYILLGVPGSEELLAQAMDEAGTEEMYFSYRLSQNSTLRNAANRWAEDNGWFDPGTDPAGKMGWGTTWGKVNPASREKQRRN